MSRIAVVHPTTLAGKQLSDRLADRPGGQHELRSLSTLDAEIGLVTELGGAAAIVGRVESGAFDGCALALFCGEGENDISALAALPADLPAIFLGRAPAGALASVAGIADEARWGAVHLANAHPLTIGLARLLQPLRSHGLSRVDAWAALPVSMLGSAGIEALFAEVRGILSFSAKRRSKLFPAQIAFNLLPLDEESALVEKELNRIWGAEQVASSVSLVRAGVFHGIALSVTVDVHPTLDLKALWSLLGTEPLVQRARQPRRLGPVDAAAEETIQVGDIRPTSAAGRFRIWATFDNLLRGCVLNALELADEILAAPRPS